MTSIIDKNDLYRIITINQEKDFNIENSFLLTLGLYYTKTKISINRREAIKTSGGSAPPHLTELQETIIGIIGTASLQGFREIPAGKSLRIISAEAALIT